jgi:hypothetical protein
MMGYVFAMGPCANCRRHFSFNPATVPSIRINGVREPICRSCVDRANPLRRANGLPEIVPAPDAYDACDENEL